VKDGELAACGSDVDDQKALQNQGYLLSQREYADFVLRFQFQQVATKYAWSGVALRAVPHETVRNTVPTWMEDIPFHLTVCVGQREGPGPNAAVPGSLWWTVGTSAFLAPDKLAALKEVGEWNNMEVEVQGQFLRIAVNGRDVQNVLMNKTRPAANPVPGLNRFSGRIGFLKRVGELRYRKVEIKELSEPKEDEQGFVPLFNGKDLSGWNEATVAKGGQCKIEDGVLMVSAKKGEYACYVTHRDYADFHLRAEVLNTGGMNKFIDLRSSGAEQIGYHTSCGGDTYASETLPIGSLAKVPPLGKVPPPGQGSVWRHPPNPVSVKPYDWFRFEIIAKGNKISVYVEDKLVQEYEDLQSSWKTGAIRLACHESTELRIRKLEIKELPPAKSGDTK
jgi:hypothetical protein